MKLQSWLIPVPACIALLVFNTAAGASTLYENDFSSQINGLTETADADWALDAAGGVYTYLRTGASGATYRGSVIEIPALGGGNTTDFIIHTRVNMLQQFGGVGLVMLADSPTLDSATHMYNAYYGRAGGGSLHVFLHERGVSSPANTPSTNTTFGVGGLTDLTVVGTYLPNGSLRLDFTYERGALVFNKTLTDPTPATGQYFGLFGYKQSGPYNFPVEADFTSLTITTVLDPIVGDLDGDGFVGITDLNIVLGAWNQSVPPGDPLADPSGDGFVGIEDLNTVLGNWNAGTPPSVVVPEPVCGLSLLTLGLMSGRRLRNTR